MISSNNEWDTLRRVILGTTKNFNFSTDDEKYIKIPNRPSGPADIEKIEETEAALNDWQSILEDMDVEVLRPDDLDYQSMDAFGAYCPRDTTLVIGDKVIFTPNVWEKRTLERPALIRHFDTNVVAPENKDIMFDAANIIRCNNDILYLVSYSGNEAGADWLQDYLGPEYKIHKLIDVYKGMHLDSSILPLREGLVMLNSEWMTDDKLPEFMKSWDKIWITQDDMWQDPEYNGMTSNWIGINVLSYDENTIFCGPKKKTLMNILKKHKVDSIPINIPNTKYFMGAHHCATLDILRSK